jgi:hypothetical protein
LKFFVAGSLEKFVVAKSAVVIAKSWAKFSENAQYFISKDYFMLPTP